MITLNTVTEVLAALANDTHLAIGSKFAYIKNNETDDVVARVKLELANEVVVSGKVILSDFESGIYYLVNEVVEKEPTQDNDHIILWEQENDIRKGFISQKRDENYKQEVGYDYETGKTAYYEDLHDDDILEREHYSINDEYHEAFLSSVGEYLENNCKVVAERYFNFTQEISSINFYKDNKWLFTVSYKSEVGDSYVIKTPTLEVTFDDNHEYSQIDDFLTLLYTANINVKK